MSDPLFSVQNKVCLVTGVSTGLGGHFARLLLSRGARVIGIARTEIDWDVGVLRDQFDNLFGDLRDEHIVESTFEHIKSKYGRLDVLVNNAGISHVSRAMEFDPEAVRDLLDINVVAASSVASKSAQLMRATGHAGSIINVTSVMAENSVTGLSAYAATKAALSQMTAGMAAEWAKHEIRVNNLAPGWIPTAMTGDFFEKGAGGVLKSRIPLRRLGLPSDLDGALMLLASDASRYMTGSTVTVDGGFTIIN